MRHRSKGDQPLFTIIEAIVDVLDPLGGRKQGRRLGEGETMLALVVALLGVVPFETRWLGHLRHRSKRGASFRYVEKVRAGRNPRSLPRYAGEYLTRSAERNFCGPSPHPPPRITRREFFGSFAEPSVGRPA